MNKLDALELSKKLNNMVITSSEFTKAYDGITSCAAQTKAYQKPIGSLLIAEGGLGKTTLSQAILKKNPCYEKQEDGYTKRVVPVFYIQIPSPATVKSVAGMMLKALNDPAPLSGTTAQMTERLCYLLKLCETELILMDEFHHLFDMQKVSRKMNIDVCNWIKTVTDSTNISSCLIGLPEFAPLLQIDSQLARRFPLIFKLSRLNIGSTQSPGTLYGFLSQVEQNIEKRLTLKFLPRLINPLFILLWAQATYIVIIGGNGYLFWTAFGLLALTILSLRPSILKNRTAFVLTAALLIYLIFNSLFCTYLILAFYCIFYLYSGNYKHKRLIKLVSLFLIMIIFALYQSQSLHELKIHYSHYNTGETWQQYGAL